MPESENLENLKRQRDQAFACAWLSLVISAAVIVSNFRNHANDLQGVTRAIEFHKDLLNQAQQFLQGNITVLHQTQAGLENMWKR